jgi:hypothetical protein
MVEFALVLPLLIVLLLGIADFGRLFAAGITVEASARNAAETGAIERLRNQPPLPSDPNFTPYYQSLHLLAAKAACSEARLLPNATFDEVTRNCPTMPIVRVCVHDDLDPICGAPIVGFDPAPPAACNHLTAAWKPWSNASGGVDGSHSVEVRVCYQFTTLFSLHLNLPMNASIQLGDIWLQKDRIFVVDCPPGDVSTC